MTQRRETIFKAHRIASIEERIIRKKLATYALFPIEIKLPFGVPA
jgi:hypothetical protein